MAWHARYAHQRRQREYSRLSASQAQLTGGASGVGGATRRAPATPPQEPRVDGDHSNQHDDSGNHHHHDQYYQHHRYQESAMASTLQTTSPAEPEPTPLKPAKRARVDSSESGDNEERGLDSIGDGCDGLGGGADRDRFFVSDPSDGMHEGGDRIGSDCSRGGLAEEANDADDNSRRFEGASGSMSTDTNTNTNTNTNTIDCAEAGGGINGDDFRAAAGCGIIADSGGGGVIGNDSDRSKCDHRLDNNTRDDLSLDLGGRGVAVKANVSDPGGRNGRDSDGGGGGVFENDLAEGSFAEGVEGRQRDEGSAAEGDAFFRLDADGEIENDDVEVAGVTDSGGGCDAHNNDGAFCGSGNGGGGVLSRCETDDHASRPGRSGGGSGQAETAAAVENTPPGDGEYAPVGGEEIAPLGVRTNAPFGVGKSAPHGDGENPPPGGGPTMEYVGEEVDGDHSSDGRWILSS